MVSDSIPTPMASDFVKKKRANRSAKLKQCKLYARRDQWLSQGNVGRNQAPATNIENERDRFIDKLEIKSSDHEVNNDSINHYSHSDSSWKGMILQEAAAVAMEFVQQV
uniref:Anti-virus transcriptional factor n=1 Tax=Solanum tuberosum TaxID=4113 RepID=M1AUX5_SOLTU